MTVYHIFFKYFLLHARSRLANDIKAGKQFNGILHSLKIAYQTEGFRGIYKGISISIPTIFIYRAIIFGGYDTWSEFIDSGKKEPSKSSFFQTAEKFIGAYLIAATAGISVYPFDTLRQRMIVTTGEKKSYDSWNQQISKIIRNEGVRALYKGLSMNLLRNLGTALAVFMYDHAKQIIV